MSLRTEGLVVPIAVANVDRYPFGSSSWGSNFEQLTPFLEQTGARDYEIHMTPALMKDLRQREKRGDMELVNRETGSQHMTFTIPGMKGHVLTAIGRSVVSPANSVKYMGYMQRRLPYAVPAVVFAEELPDWVQAADDPLTIDRLFREQTFEDGSLLPLSVAQPCAEVYQWYDVRTNEELIERLGLMGIKLCPDAGHARRNGKDGFEPPSWEDVWPGQFASGCVYEMHVSSDRQDMKSRDPDFAALSAREFTEFTSSYWRRALNTDLGEMVVAAIENYVPPPDYMTPEQAQNIGGPALRMVVEIPPLPQISAIRQRISQHAQFIENLAKIIQHAGATPLLWDTPMAE